LKFDIDLRYLPLRNKRKEFLKKIIISFFLFLTLGGNGVVLFGVSKR